MAWHIIDERLIMTGGLPIAIDLCEEQLCSILNQLTVPTL
jgi:hypothetical protein